MARNYPQNLTGNYNNAIQSRIRFNNVISKTEAHVAPTQSVSAKKPAAKLVATPLSKIKVTISAAERAAAKVATKTNSTSPKKA